MTLHISQFPCLQDNYGFLVRDLSTGAVATIDTPDAEAITRAVSDAGWTLTHILNTHHHADHAGGNLELKARWNCRVIGPRAEAAKIPGLDAAVGEGDIVHIGASSARVVDTPGHTRGHIVYWFEAAGAAFVGDTLFALGCGRLFEGTPDQMWDSLGKIAAFPDETRLYCAHEYTQSNARFALTVDAENVALHRRAAEVAALRARGEPTVPTTVALERLTNPFLRADTAALKEAAGIAHLSGAAAFAEIRRRKDIF